MILPKKIAIIGGSGVVGVELALELSNNYQIKIIDITEPTIDTINDIEFDMIDICNYSRLKESLMDVDLVIHTAIIQIPLINEKKKVGYDVNINGIQNVCRCVEEIDNCKGMILTGTWHTMGEHGWTGEIDERYGYKPDYVGARAKLYAFSKITQEMIVRYYSEMTGKYFGIVRLGTVLGVSMPSRTAASIFIKKGLQGQDITPYKHSMHRPMLYVDIRNIRTLFHFIVDNLLSTKNEQNICIPTCVNIWYPEPITIIELAKTIKNIITSSCKNKQPKIKIVDHGLPSNYPEEKPKIKINVSIAESLLGQTELISPETSIKWIIDEYENME